MDLENMKYNSKDKIFHNKCKFCGKDLKPIGLDYLYANMPLTSIEYERCDCKKSKAYWNEIDLKEEIQKKPPQKLHDQRHGRERYHIYGKRKHKCRSTGD